MSSQGDKCRALAKADTQSCLWKVSSLFHAGLTHKKQTEMMVQHDLLKTKGKEEFVLLKEAENQGRLPGGSKLLGEPGRMNRNKCSPTAVHLVISGLASCHTGFAYD